MSLITKSSRAVLVGGALFALPLLLFIVLGNKAIQLLVPSAKKLVDAFIIPSPCDRHTFIAQVWKGISYYGYPIHWRRNYENRNSVGGRGKSKVILFGIK